MKCNKCPVIAECQMIGLKEQKTGRKICPLLWMIEIELRGLKELVTATTTTPPGGA